MSSQAPPEPVLQPEPDVLAFGPAEPSRSRRRILVVVVVVVGLLLGGGWLFRALYHPTPDLTLEDLQAVYGGMVRADGTNDASTAHRDQATGAREPVSPASCSPLFDFTLSNQFPAAAIDGVSTYWLNEGQASISLVTYRYPSKAAARADFDRVSAALDQCTGTSVRVRRQSPVTVTRQPLPPPKGVKSYLSYLVASTPEQGRFGTNVALLDNTLTWQYRYDYSRAGSYSPLPAEQLMGSLFIQMLAVQGSHR